MSAKSTRVAKFGAACCSCREFLTPGQAYPTRGGRIFCSTRCATAEEGARRIQGEGPRLHEIEESAREIGRAVGHVLDGEFGPKAVGFCLMLFTFGEGGWSTYLSNADPKDMIAALRELADKRERQLKETGR